MHLEPFRITCDCALMQGKIEKYKWEENELYCGNVDLVHRQLLLEK